jgi:uncharacterized protein DUF3435
MYVEDLKELLRTNITTTKKLYKVGRIRIEISLIMQLGGFNANRPNAILSLRYRDILVTLLRDQWGGDHRTLLEFTYEFTKEFLGPKAKYVYSISFIDAFHFPYNCKICAEHFNQEYVSNP